MGTSSLVRRHLLGATLLALAASAAGAADADVTAREVWEDWVAAVEGGAAALTTDAVEERDGALVVRGLAMSSEMADGSYALRIDRVELAEEGGAVRVTMSPSYPVTLEGRDAEGRTTTLVLEVRHPGLVLTVSGDEQNRRHAYTAPEIAVELVEATQEGDPVDLDLAVTLTETSGSYAVAEGQSRFDSAFAAESLDLAVSGTDPREGDEIDVSLQMSELAAENVTSFLDLEMADIAEALREGFESDGALSYGPARYAISGTDEDGRFAIEGAAESGEIAAALSADGLVYSGRNAGSRLVLSGDEVPVPEIVLDVAESEGVLSMPVLAGEGAQPFGLTLRLVDAAMSEQVWSLIDPAGVLPRDAATLVLDVSGTASLSRDLLGDAATGAVPGAVETLALDELRLSALGGELTGSGELAFEPAPGESAMPRPVGEITLRLVGGEALLDRLVRIGLVPEGEAVGMRMMLGLFTRPAEGEDALTSTIRFTEDGQVIANGQRIR